MLEERTVGKAAIIKAEVTKELRRKVKVRAAERDTSVARYVREAVEQRLAKEDGEQKHQDCG